MGGINTWHSKEADKLYLVGSLTEGFRAYWTLASARKARHGCEAITEISVWTEGNFPDD